MMRIILFCFCFCFPLGLARTNLAQVQIANSSALATDAVDIRQQGRLNGLVRRVRVETVTLIVKKGITVEGPRVVREVTTYDLNGQKIDSVAYPADDSRLSGHKQYLQDAKGNTIGMVLRGNDGSILNQERYDYQFDEFGNWKQMTASIAIYENGKIGYEPFEITYRTITYFLGQTARKVATAPSVTPISNSTTATPVSGNGPSQITKPTVILATGTAANGIAPIQAEKTLSAPQALIMKPEKKEPSMPPPPAVVTPKDDEHLPPVAKVSEGAPRKTPINLPKAPESTVSPAGNGTPSELKTSQSNPGVSDLKILLPEDSLEANPKPANDPVAPSDSLYLNGLTLLASGRNSEAAETLKQATNRDPNDGAAYAKLGLAYVALQQYPEAVAVLKMAIKIKPEIVDAEAYFQLSNAYSALGKFPNALEAIKQAMYVQRAEQANHESANTPGSPSFEDLHYATGLACFNLHRYSQAIEELKQVIALNPKRAQAYYGLALSYLASGNRKSAEKQQQTLEALDPVFAARVAKLLSSSSNQQQGFGFVFQTSR